MFTLFASKKKKYFLRRIDQVQKMIWDAEFKREKTEMIREEVRREYDNTCSKLLMVTTKIKAQLKEPEKICEVHNQETGKEPLHKDKGTCACVFIDNFIGKDEMERFYDEVTLLSREKARFTDQMNGMDIDMHGSPATNDYPNGVVGQDAELEGLREAKAMLQETSKKY